MAEEDKVLRHDLVTQILDDMAPEEGGPVLPEDAFVKWAAVLREHRDAKTVAEQLVVVGVRFLHSQAEASARQLALLAVIAADADWVRQRLEGAGLGSDESKKLVGDSAGVPTKGVEGLAPPKSGGPGRKG